MLSQGAKQIEDEGSWSLIKLVSIDKNKFVLESPEHLHSLRVFQR